MFRPLKPHQIAIDALIAVLFLGTFGVLFTMTAAAGGTEILVALGMSAAVAVRRWAPGLALGIAWVTALAQMLAGMPPVPSDVAVFVVLYVTAAYGGRIVFWAGLVSAFVGAVAISVYLVFVTSLLSGGTVDIRSLPLAVFVLVAAVFALGLAWTAGALVRTAVRARENRIARDAAQAEAIAEQERVRIARDMHDVVAHSLAVVVAQADGARYAAAADPQVATDALATIGTTARAALTDVRLLLTQLRHSQGDGPQPSLTDLDALFRQVQSAGVDLRVAIAPVPPDAVPASVQLAVYRILQEALTNALRHGSAGPVEVWVSWYADRVRLAVRNVAAAEPAPAPARGHGIVGMQERAQLVGGGLCAGFADGAFTVDAELPIGAIA